MMKIERALISVSNKNGLVGFAKGLVDLGIKIISSRGTAEVLERNGIDVRVASKLTHFPEMLGGKVKTLHPKIHGGILADRKREEDIHELEELGIETIDLVIVNLYPFEDEVGKKDTIETALENIDIGGSALIRSAAKNYRNVGIVVEPEEYDQVLKGLKNSDRELGTKTRRKLAMKAFAHIAEYDRMISDFFQDKFGETSPED